MASAEKRTSLPLQKRDAAVERWLRDDVAPTYDRMMADPKRGVSPEEMAERARRRHAVRIQSDA